MQSAAQGRTPFYAHVFDVHEISSVHWAAFQGVKEGNIYYLDEGIRLSMQIEHRYDLKSPNDTLHQGF